MNPDLIPYGSIWARQAAPPLLCHGWAARWSCRHRCSRALEEVMPSGWGSATTALQEPVPVAHQLQPPPTSCTCPQQFGKSNLLASCACPRHQASCTADTSASPTRRPHARVRSADLWCNRYEIGRTAGLLHNRYEREDRRPPAQHIRERESYACCWRDTREIGEDKNEFRFRFFWVTRFAFDFFGHRTPLLIFPCRVVHWWQRIRMSHEFVMSVVLINSQKISIFISVV
jgi:hypothetical protein